MKVPLRKRRGGGMMDAFNEDDDAVFGLMSRVVSEGDKADGVLKGMRRDYLASNG